MKYEKNFSGWQKAMNLANKPLTTVLDTDKIDSIKKLMSSQLPTYDYKIYELSDFNTEEIDKLKDKYGQLVIRLCPKSKDFQRYTLIDLKKEEIISKIDSIKDKREYHILINEYDPAEFSGIVIGEQNKILIEMAKEPNLEKLAHGEIIPYSAEFNLVDPRGRRMIFHNVEDADIMAKMWQIMKYIIKINKDNEFYMEFVISDKTKQVKFLEFIEKNNQQMKGGRNR